MGSISSGAIGPIAVVGIGCRMPGSIRSPTELWDLLMSQGIANKSHVPSSRFDIGAYLHPSNDRPGSFNVPGGYFLDDDPKDFDPEMFNISPVEASWMDPQQRKLLEVVYEAFENSGTTLEMVANRNIGCFVGSFTSDFQQMSAKEPDFRHAYAAIGVDPGIIGNRISYVFNLRGPRSISSGECDGAVVGGVNLILTVDQHMNTATMGVLSPTNQSHAFDEAADGYGRAEGVGALYLKPLSSAIIDGDPIRAIIRSTATGSSGASEKGITHPSMQAQMDVIASAYKSANITTEFTDYVECHGTGTPVGDPIEVEAINRAFGCMRSTSTPMLIGSVKPNVGHSEAASSMATLIKAILALENGIIPPTAGLTKLSSHIPWDDYNVQVVAKPTAFPNTSSIHRIGVSAFGYGGTNAHAILESTKSSIPNYRGHKLMRHGTGVLDEPDHEASNADHPHLLLFSAHNEATLKNNIIGYSTCGTKVDLIDLAYTLGIRRTKLAHRAFSIVRNGSFESDVTSALDNFVPTTRKAAPAFVFTGQGSQWSRMGARLLEMFPSVLQTIRRLDEHLSTLVSPPTWKIETLLTDPEENNLVNEPEYSQPLCTAVQIALFDLMTSWNVRPVATIGHSSGEIAASYAAGKLSAGDAITAAYFRGKVVASLGINGAMIAVGLGADEVNKHIEEAAYCRRVVIACYNSSSSVTLSGDRDAIEGLHNILTKKKIFARVLRTGWKAYHSHHMVEAASRYYAYLQADSAENHNQDAVEVPMFSTVRKGHIIGKGEYIQHEYWAENLRNPVLFDEGVQNMLETLPHIDAIIEIGPHPTLAGPIRQIIDATNMQGVTYMSTLERNKHDGEQMLRLGGIMWASDMPINVSAVMGNDGTTQNSRGSLLVDLPPYHWTYSKQFWSESRISNEHRTIKHPRHDILGRRILGTPALNPIWRNVLRQKDLPWLVQHRLGGEVMMPATGYIALALEAVTQLNAEADHPQTIQSYTLRDITIFAATVVPDDEGTETLFWLQPLGANSGTFGNGNSNQRYQFTSSFCFNGVWKQAAQGSIVVNSQGPMLHHHAAHGLPDTPKCEPHVDWLEKLRSLGIDLGPVFHRIGNVYTNGKTCTARGDLRIDQQCGLMEAESRYVLHPTVLDSCLQPGIISVHQGRLEDMRCGTIPTHFGEVTIYPPTPEHLANACTLQVWTPHLGNRAYQSNTQLIAYDGSLLVDMSRCRHLLYGAALPHEMQGDSQQDLYLKHDWKIDLDYIGNAVKEGALSHQPLAAIVDIILHKDVTTQTLCLDRTLVETILAIRPNMSMTIAVPSKEVNEDYVAQFSGIEALSIMELDIGSLEGNKINQSYDLIITPELSHSDRHILNHVRQLMTDNGRALIRTNVRDIDEWASALESAGFSGTDGCFADATILATAVERNPTMDRANLDTDNEILLVYRDVPTPLLSVVSDVLGGSGWVIRVQSIATIDILDKERVVLLVDAEGPFLAQIQARQLEKLIHLTENAKAITWVTCGGLLSGEVPEYGMTEGAARVIRNEKSSLDLVTVDYDTGATSSECVASLLNDILTRQRSLGRNGETEYYLEHGVVHIGRIVSHREIIRKFVPYSGELIELPYNQKPAVQGGLENGTLVFHRDDERVGKPLGSDEVEVKVATIGVTLSDGDDDASFLSHEFAGTVVRVGGNVRDIAPAATVVGIAYDRLATFQRTSRNLVQPIHPGTPLTEAATIPSAFTAAIYGLEELARVQSGENVAIVEGLGGIGLAAIQLCRVLGANPIMVSPTEASKHFLSSNGLLSSDRVISSRDGALGDQLERVTAGTGIDVILWPSVVDEATTIGCSHVLARFGRIVSVEQSVNTTPAMSTLPFRGKNATSFTFSLKDVVSFRQQLVSRSLKRCVQLYEQGQIKPLPRPVITGSAAIQDIFKSMRKDTGLGECTVLYDDKTVFRVLPSSLPLQFDGSAAYLMVGCLGGIGRRLAFWMAERGAKYLAFVSRTGTSNPEAAATVNSLEQLGVEVMVLHANVLELPEIARAVALVQSVRPIRGVVNAAAVLRDGLFRNMTIGSWQAVCDTKVKGCLNLHEVLKDELDFFVMTSSITATLGSTGQSNYGAANSFMDSLARHRRFKNLAGVSLDLPAILGVGLIHDSPELLQSIRAKGMYGLHWKEMLKSFEIAMTPRAGLPAGVDHIAIGIQPRLFGQAIQKAGAHIPWKEEPRLNWLEHVVKDQAGNDTLQPDANSQSMVASMRQAPCREEAVSILTSHITRRLARLLMIEPELVHPTQKSLASHGLDSMIGAEFRNWMFREFAVDFPFQQLLTGGLTISDLAEILAERLGK
ncbi:hypothetical protein AB5N19_11697 [Seiridium cardinale]